MAVVTIQTRLTISEGAFVEVHRDAHRSSFHPAVESHVFVTLCGQMTIAFREKRLGGAVSYQFKP